MAVPINSSDLNYHLTQVYGRSNQSTLGNANYVSHLARDKPRQRDLNNSKKYVNSKIYENQARGLVNT